MDTPSEDQIARLPMSEIIGIVDDAREVIQAFIAGHPVGKREKEEIIERLRVAARALGSRR